MKLTVLGCSGSAPGPSSPASCYLVQADGFALVLDLGNGALGPLQAVLDVADIGAVFLSHLHPDHCLDMASLVVALDRPGARIAAPIPVLADALAPRRLASVMWPDRDPGTLDALFAFRCEADRLGPFAISTAPVNHPVPTRAVRVEHAGRSLVYSGDTGPSPALIGLARGADVLLCEAAAPPGTAGSAVHLTGVEAGEHARAAGVGRLLITHVPPWESVDAALTGAREAFGGPVAAVFAGASYEV